MSIEPGEVDFLATALDDLRDFPKAARQTAGYQIHRVQVGLEPNDWKPMPSVGSGVREIRVHAQGEFRVMYVAKFGDKIYVLHCFHKKAKKTSEVDIRLAKKRYADLLTHLRETKK